VFGSTRDLNCAALLVSSLALMAPAAARAQVLEVAPDGSVRQLGVAAPAAQARSCANAELMPAFQTAAARQGLSVDLLLSVARTESNCDANAVSPAGAIGVMQLMPATARELGVDPHDPRQNIEGGAAYLRQQIDRFGGRIDLALAAYNAGPGPVARSGAVPAFSETRSYVGQNLDQLADLSLSEAP
jgi:soluble lytic murein transglycosylase-like protein